MIRCLASTMPVSTDITGPVLILTISPVLTANSQPSLASTTPVSMPIFHQYVVSTRNAMTVLAWYRASSKFPPRYSMTIFTTFLQPFIEKYIELF